MPSCTPLLRRSGGPLVVLGSMLGEVPSPLMSAYVTSKHGVHGLVRSLQAELGRSGPPVVLVEPSAVRTPIYRKAGTQAGAHGAPVPPVVDPEKVARRVLVVLDRPRRTVRVGPLVRPAVALYRLLPGTYEALARQSATRLGLQHADPVSPTAGVVLRPRPAADAVHGPPVRRRFRDLVRPGSGPRTRLSGPSRGTGAP